MLRFPRGQTKERRFHKNNKIGDVYNYIDSLNDASLFNENHKNYELMTPFPPKAYTDRNLTLEEAGFYPNSVLQIHEL